MKTKTLVLAAIMFLGLGAAAFAQGTFSVGSIPVTAVISTGLTEQTGAITFNLTGGAAVAGTFNINYGVPITVPIDPAFISVVGGTLNTTLSNGPAGVLVITVAAGATSITVSNVRVAVAGTTLTSLSATITATGNAITAGQTTVTVISSIAPGIASVTDKNTKVSTVNSVNGAITTNNLRITEGFLNAWQANLSAPSFLGSGIRLTVSGLPPANVSFQFPLVANTDQASVFAQASCGDLRSLVGAGSEATINSTSSTPTQVCYVMMGAGANASTNQEVLSITPVITVAAGATFPLGSGTLTYTATMAPIGTAFGSDGKVITTLPAGYIPRFVAAEVGPATALNVVGNNTILLMPFAQVYAAGGYDTGIAIANTTTDPGKTVLGMNVPTKQAGAITFYFFPQAVKGVVPSSFKWSTTQDATVGNGQDSNGLIPSGSTYVVALSQLLLAAQKSGDFNGYIFAMPTFTNAHGLFVISNFSTFSQGALMPVIQAPRDTFIVPVAAPIAEQTTF